MNDIDFLRQEDVATFIGQNIDRDVGKLLLNPPKQYNRAQIRLIIDQIHARQKAKGKLDHWLANKHLIFPPPVSVEQASSFLTSEYKKGIIKGAKVIDLTGGTGIDCLSLSEIFSKTTYVEQNKWLCQVFDHNQKILGKNMEVVHDTAESYLLSFKGKACFFLDPARRTESNQKVFRLKDCSPDILGLLEELRKKANQVMIKLSPLVDITDTIRQIPDIKEIHVVSINNDCKEVLLLLDHLQPAPTTIYATNLGTNQSSFEFQMKEERASKSRMGTLANYLYEPNASILKAGAFKSIGKSLELDKIAPNTHLYTSDTWVKAFPGKQFKVLSRNPKSDLEKYAPNGKINVVTRNYIVKASELKKQFGLKDGGDFYLIGFRDQANTPFLIIANRIDLPKIVQI